MTQGPNNMLAFEEEDEVVTIEELQDTQQKIMELGQIMEGNMQTEVPSERIV